MANSISTPVAEDLKATWSSCRIWSTTFSTRQTRSNLRYELLFQTVTIGIGIDTRPIQSFSDEPRPIQFQSDSNQNWKYDQNWNSNLEFRVQLEILFIEIQSRPNWIPIFQLFQLESTKIWRVRPIRFQFQFQFRIQSNCDTLLTRNSRVFLFSDHMLFWATTSKN